MLKKNLLQIKIFCLWAHYLYQELCKSFDLFRNGICVLSWFWLNHFDCFKGVDLGKAFDIPRNLQGSTFFASVTLKVNNWFSPTVYIFHQKFSWKLLKTFKGCLKHKADLVWWFLFWLTSGRTFLDKLLSFTHLEVLADRQQSTDFLSHYRSWLQMQ